MPATTLDLIIEQGVTFSQAIALGASTWDGQAVTAQIRSTFGGALLGTFTGVIASSRLVTGTPAAVSTLMASVNTSPGCIRLTLHD